MIALARRTADSSRFQNFILAVIVLTAVLVGVETSETLTARYGPLFDALDAVVQAIFVVEIAVRLLACWPRPLAFFRDGWNVFDFAVIVASLLPQAGAFAMVARLARLMRVTRLVSVFPELRLIIGTMLRSIPSMGHVIMLLGLLLYVYAILGLYLFRAVDPEHWGGLGAALLTLFQMLTLEGWVELQDSVLGAYPLAWIYFGSFIFVAVFVVVNLFIAVVINNLESVKHEQQLDADRDSPHRALLQSIEELRKRLEDMERQLRETPSRLAR
ncbi:MAG TPA: ion transporter [Candidatus Tectomicrobia bacterium]|nr:ion transporter [Candidatus Tectomicrobia bacterium]